MQTQKRIFGKAVGGALFARDRFVVLLALCLCTSICARYYLSLGLCIAAGLAFVPFLFWKKNTKRVIAMCAMWMIGIVVCSCALAPLREAMLTEERTVELSGIVTRVDAERGCYTLTSVSVDGEQLRGDFTYWAAEDEDLPDLYSRIHCDCKLRVKNVFGNAGNDYVLISNTRNDNWLYFTGGKAITAEPAELSLGQKIRFGGKHFFDHLRASIRASAFENISDPDAAALCYGMLVGDTSYVDDETYAVYRDGGILHLLAVSGLHISAISMALAFVIGKLPMPAYLRAILCCSVVGFYVCLCGGSVSAQRAAILFVITTFAPLVFRRADALCSLAVAAIVILLHDPLSVFNIGFRLSFEAVLAIDLLAKDWSASMFHWLDRFRLPQKRAICDLCAVTVAAQLGVLPCLLAVYGTTPLVSFFINPVVVPFSGVLLLVSWLTVVGDWIGCLAPFFGKVTEIMFTAITELTRWASGLFPDLVMPFWCGTWMRVLFFLLLFALSSYCLLQRKHKRILCTVLAALLVIGCGAGLIKEKNERSITMLDVGQGQCVLVEVNNENILIDCGTSVYGGIPASQISSTLVRNGAAHIDGMILSHNDSDHTNRAVELTQLLDVDEIICGSTCLAEFDDASCRVVTPEDAALCALRDGTIKILAGNGTEDNEDSYIIGVYLDETSVLIMGDATRESEEKLLARGLAEHDVLIVGHHGSDTSSSAAFLKACGADTALISAGRNNFYGHPDAGVLLRLEKQNMDIFCTAECGMIYMKDGDVPQSAYPQGYPFEGGQK